MYKINLARREIALKEEREDTASEMDIGNGFYIANQYFEGAERIGKQDRTGIELAIGDRVAIRGCRARFGYIGRNAEGKSVVYFATTTTTAMWELTPTPWIS